MRNIPQQVFMIDDEKIIDDLKEIEQEKFDQKAPEITQERT